jgi:hypothetical protein
MIEFHLNHREISPKVWIEGGGEDGIYHSVESSLSLVWGPGQVFFRKCYSD